MNLRKIYQSRIWLVVLIGLAAALSARAQNNTTFNPVTGNWEFNPWSTQNVMIRQMERSRQMFGTGARAGGGYATTVLPRHLAASWSATFDKIMQNGAATRAARGRDIIKRGRATTSFSPAATPVLVRYFTGDSVQSSVAADYLPRALETHRKFLRNETYSPNDVVDNFLLGVEVYYLIYKGKFNAVMSGTKVPEELDNTERRAVREQISKALLNDENFQGLSDEQKQAVHEMFSIALINAMVDTQDAAKNPTRLRALQTGAGYALQQITGIPPAKIVITADGISSK